jgi:hypothetical protein
MRLKKVVRFLWAAPRFGYIAEDPRVKEHKKCHIHGRAIVYTYYIAETAVYSRNNGYSKYFSLPFLISIQTRQTCKYELRISPKPTKEKRQ